MDRHVAAGHGAQSALIGCGRDRRRAEWSYAGLAAHGIARADRLFLLCGRVPELYATTLGALKSGVVVSPMFAAFGPEPVRARVEIGQAGVLVTTADPGWVTGMSQGIVAPLCNRAMLVVDEAEFDLERWYGILETERVQVWYTAPTAIRMMMRAGPEAAAGRDFAALRCLASVGEPLNAECVLWGMAVFGLPFHDNGWPSETGGIMIADMNCPGFTSGRFVQRFRRPY